MSRSGIVPSIAGTPSIPGIPSDPSLPGIPSDPSIPSVPSVPSVPGAGTAELFARLRRYERPDDRRALRQVAESVVPFVVSWLLALRCLEVSYGLTLLWAAVAAGFLMRISVLTHDLGHGSLLRSRRANEVLGTIFGVLTLIPFHHWNRLHRRHHGNYGDLDRRGSGYLMTLTVVEYLKLTRWGRLRYRLYRNPLLLFGYGTIYYFFLVQRVPYSAPRSWRCERRSVYLTNLGIAALVAALCAAVGWRRFLLVQLPVAYLSELATMWMFYIQHQFDSSYWESGERWDFVRSALEGSSYYQLPRFLQWLTANLGFHHVHHLDPKIPNYNLERCHREIPELSAVPPVTLRQSFRMVRLKLWDERRGRLVSFRDAAGAPPLLGTAPSP